MARDTEYRNGRNPMQIADDVSSGKPPQTEPRRPAAPEAPRAPNRKSKWERAGMTRSEYERGIEQNAREKRDALLRQDVLDRARKGQSNPGN